MTRTLKLLKNNRHVLLTTLNQATITYAATEIRERTNAKPPKSLSHQDEAKENSDSSTNTREPPHQENTPKGEPQNQTNQNWRLQTQPHSTSPPSSASSLNQIGKKPKTTIKGWLHRAETHRNTAKEGHHHYGDTVAWFGSDRRQTERHLQKETNKAKRAQLRCYESHWSWIRTFRSRSTFLERWVFQIFG